MSVKVSISEIRTDGGTQPRAEINDALVGEYAEAMRAGATFPPVVAFWDGVHWWLADGFHRIHAARRVGLTDIDVSREDGSKRDAILYSVGVNSSHGQRRTNADKRKAVMTLLEDTEWSQWSNHEIARQCAVSESFVRSLRTKRSDDSDDPPPPRTYTNKHGQTAQMNTANIGHSKQSDDDPEAPPIERPKSRGKGLRFAHEAIAALKRIPNQDGLRGEAFDLVTQWIKDNR